MKNLIKRVTVLALCFTLIMSCVIEATPQDLQNMSGRDITAAFKAQKLKVKKAPMILQQKKKKIPIQQNVQQQREPAKQQQTAALRQRDLQQMKKHPPL